MVRSHPVSSLTRRNVFMIDPTSLPLPLLPLVLWEPPPGLELALAQEGVPFVKIREPHPLAFRAGRFVLFDGRRITPGQIRANLSGDHVAIDLDVYRLDERVDPFRVLIDTEGAPALVDGRGALGGRAGRTVSQGPGSSQGDRPTPPGGHEGRGNLGEAGELSVPIPVGLQPPTRPRRTRPRRLRPVRRGPPAARRLLDPFPEHRRLRWLPERARRPSRCRHPVARPLPLRLPRSGRQRPQPGAGPSLAGRGRVPARGIRRSSWSLERRDRRGPRRPGLFILVRLPARLRRPAVFPLAGRPVLEGLAGPGASALRGGFLRGRWRCSGRGEPLREGDPGQGRGLRAGVRLRPPRRSAGPPSRDRRGIGPARSTASPCSGGRRSPSSPAGGAGEANAGGRSSTGPKAGSKSSSRSGMRLIRWRSRSSEASMSPRFPSSAQPPSFLEMASSTNAARPGRIYRLRRSFEDRSDSRPPSARRSTGRRSRRSTNCRVAVSRRRSSAS